MNPSGTAVFDTLFRREMLPHMDHVYNYAFRMTNNAEDAGDLTQETYLKAFRFIRDFRAGTNAKAWLFRILKNSFINIYRKRQRSPKPELYATTDDYDESMRECSLPENDLRREIFDHLLSDDVVNALQALSEEFRTIIILSDIEAFSYEEIAESLSIPLGTVRSRLYRARRVLREKLYAYAAKGSVVTKEVLHAYGSGHSSKILNHDVPAAAGSRRSLQHHPDAEPISSS
jgi:RNA polymerase sigma-70 factor (ECF subfamily)